MHIWPNMHIGGVVIFLFYRESQVSSAWIQVSQYKYKVSSKFNLWLKMSLFTRFCSAKFKYLESSWCKTGDKFQVPQYSRKLVLGTRGQKSQQEELRGDGGEKGQSRRFFTFTGKWKWLQLSPYCCSCGIFVSAWRGLEAASTPQ